MLRVLPFILLWLGGWALYFPAADENPPGYEGSGAQARQKGGPPSNCLVLRANAGDAPAGWKQWFICSGAGMLLLAVLLYHGSRLHRSQQDERQSRRLRELEAAALCSRMNPHFLFNALNSIQSCIAQGDKQAASRYLADFSRLVRSTLNQSAQPKITLLEEIDTLRNYLELEQLRFREDFEWRLTVAENIDAFEITLPPMLVQPFVENAIVHGLVPKNSNGVVEVDFRQQGEFLVITVTDNGIGIGQSLRQKEQATFSPHRSVGMALARRRLELLEPNKPDNMLEIEELTNASGRVMGTQVRLKISLREEAAASPSLLAMLF